MSVFEHEVYSGIPLFQVVNKLLLTSVGQNVKYALRCRIGDDTLIFDIAGIALKFVDGEYMRKLLGMRKAQHIENPYNRGNREINGFSNRSERTLTSELIDYMSNQAACHAVVSRDKGMLFGEAFAAMGTAVSSAPVIEDNGLTVPSQEKWTQKSFKKRNESQNFVGLRKPTAFIPRFA